MNWTLLYCLANSYLWTCLWTCYLKPQYIEWTQKMAIWMMQVRFFYEPKLTQISDLCLFFIISVGLCRASSKLLGNVGQKNPNNQKNPTSSCQKAELGGGWAEEGREGYGRKMGQRHVWSVVKSQLAALMLPGGWGVAVPASDRHPPCLPPDTAGSSTAKTAKDVLLLPVVITRSLCSQWELAGVLQLEDICSHKSEFHPGHRCSFCIIHGRILQGWGFVWLFELGFCCFWKVSCPH